MNSQTPQPDSQNLPNPPRPPHTRASQDSEDSNSFQMNREYLRTMQKDIADMEAKKAEQTRKEILKRGFVPPSPPKPPVPPDRHAPPKPPVQPPPVSRPSQPPQYPPTKSVPPPAPPRQPQPFRPKPPRPVTSKPSVTPQPPPPPSSLSAPPRESALARDRAAQFQLPPKKKKAPLVKILAPIIVVLLLAGGGAGVWYFFGRNINLPCLPIICEKKVPPALPTPQPQPEPRLPTPAPTPAPEPKAKPVPQIPAGLIRSDNDIVLEVQNIQEIQNALSQELKKEAPIHSITRIEFLVSKERFASFEEFLEASGISMPAELRGALDGRYSAFRFWQKEGGRLGFVVQVKDFAAAKRAAKDWETSMVSDTEQFFALHGKQGNIGPFTSASWRGVPFRYYDFLPDKLGIVYALHEEQNLFIFTTSGEGMIEVINRVELK